jgi:hypothetical protein
VPLLQKRRAPIAHNSITHAEKTLGAMTSPDGSSRALIKMMQEKVQKWVNNVRNGHLHQRNVWFSLKVQFWPRIGYGLCSSTASFNELDRALHRQYYQILPLGGVVRTTMVESRTIDVGFYGVGLPHLGVEALIVMSNKLIMHYGCNTAVGRFMKASYPLFLMEMGLSLQPLQESYEWYEYLLTHCWMKMLWEKVSMFGLKVVVADFQLKYPREGDRFIKQVLIELRFTKDKLRILNQVQVSLQVLFLLDLLTASGQKINLEILSQCPPAETWSKMRWSNKQPTKGDFQLWRSAMQAICPSQQATTQVGQFIAPMHKI